MPQSQSRRSRCLKPSSSRSWRSLLEAILRCFPVLAVAGLAMRRWSDVQLRGLGYLPPLDERGIVDGEALAQNLSRIRGEENARV